MATSDRLKAKIIDGGGNVTGERDLPEELFGGPVNVPLMHQVVTAQLAAGRAGSSDTKTRSEVRGGGVKPWRQKGTGRARHGSIRSPQWVGGGTVFGPHPRDYTQRTPKKMKRGALRSALADKVLNDAVFVLDGFSESKTKAAAAALATAGIDGKVLIVLDPAEDGSRVVDRAFRNLRNVAFSLYGSVGTYDVVAADVVVFTPGALDGFTNPKPVAQEEEPELQLESGGER